MLDTQYSQYIQHRIDQKTKPHGALGLLEKVAHQLALIQSQGKQAAVEHIELNTPSIIIFAGDHGIADEGVSIAPSAVTQQMVLKRIAQDPNRSFLRISWSFFVQRSLLE